MPSIYNLLVRTYGLLIYVFAAFNPKARLWVEGRKKWRIRLRNEVSRVTTPGVRERWIWFHCSSLGEYEDCHEVMVKVKQIFLEHKFLLTFSSPSGYEVKKNSKVCDVICYLPLDTPGNASSFLEVVQPEFIFFSRSELWFNYLAEIKRREVPIFLISLYLNSRSGFLKWPWRIIYQDCFHTFQHIFCQTEATKKILEIEFGFMRSSVTGNTRNDRIISEAIAPQVVPGLEKFVGNNFSVIVGSCEPEDEKIIFEVFQKLKDEAIKWIVVPHEFEKSAFAKFEKNFPGDVLRYSNIDRLQFSHKMIFIDFVGALKHIYQYGDFSVVGGGFRREGIHNIIEPARYGHKIAFGPNHRNYTEALELLKIEAAKIFSNSEELLEIVKQEYRAEIDSARQSEIIEYVDQTGGASDKIFEKIKAELQI